MTSKTDNTDLSALTGALDDTAAPIRELNDKVIAAAKQSGTQSLDAYEKTLASLLSFGEKVAGATQLDWVPPSRQRLSCSEPAGIQMMSKANIHKSVHKCHENGPRRSLRGPFPLVAGTGFEPATSGL
jgi:hypothetical protein